MTLTFDQFLYGIQFVESGGNYSAKSSVGALGRWQIMPANIPAWSKEALGHSVTPDEFLASPQIQDKVAVFELKKYYDQYGPAKAATAWNSGSPNGNEQGNYHVKVLEAGAKAPDGWAGFALSVLNGTKDYSKGGASSGNDPVTGSGTASDVPGLPIPLETVDKWDSKKVLTTTERMAMCSWLLACANSTTNAGQDGWREAQRVGTPVNKANIQKVVSNNGANGKGYLPDSWVISGYRRGAKNLKGHLPIPPGLDASPLGFIVKLFTTLASGAFWRRVGLGLAGVLLLGTAAVMVLEGGGNPATAAKSLAGKVVPKVVPI